MVMHRFYILWNALSAVYQDVCNNPDNDKFSIAFSCITLDNLKTVILLLYPLVKAINFCQRDSSLSFDGYTTLMKLKEKYENMRIPGFEKNDVEKLFSRIELFSNYPSALIKLFSLTDSLSFEDEKTLIDECIDEIKSYSFPGMDDDYISERAAIEVPSFLEFGVKRGRATVAEFFVSHKRRRSDIQFNILSQVHDIVKSQCASSASVERSFSEQALIQTPRRRRLKYETVNNLMMIKCNLKFLQRQHKEEDLREYLFNNNPIDSLLNK